MNQVNLPTRLLRSLALSVLLLAGAHSRVVAELPSAPEPQSPAQVVPAAGTITGTIADSDGGSIEGARVTLTREGNPPADAIVAISTSDGRFTISNVPPGPFSLSISRPGFAPRQTSGELHPGEIDELSTIALSASATTNVQVTASQSDIAEAQINQEEKQRVLGIVPNFYVSYVSDPVPLTPKQKFELALKTMVDPVSFGLTGVTAAVEQADNLYDWGQGAQGYGKRYAAAYGTFLTSDILGNAVFPILFKQDPRYFYKGTGSIRSRALYAIATAVVSKGDNHHWQPDYSGILGGITASGLSNAYYPASDRTGPGVIFEGAAIGIGIGAVQNLIQEFLVRKLTPHIPASP
jgi:hypothetical protein